MNDTVDMDDPTELDPDPPVLAAQLEPKNQHLKISTLSVAICKLFMVIVNILLYFIFISSKGVLFVLAFSSVDLVMPCFAFHALRTSKASFLIPYMVYLIFNCMKNVAVSTFCIYGFLNPEEYYNIYCGMYLCSKAVKPLFEMRLFLGTTGLLLFGEVVATLWFFVVVRNCYKYLHKRELNSHV